MFGKDPFLVGARIDWEGVERRDEYPFSIPAIAQIDDDLKLDPKVTFFVGENGSGKSTLLEAIAVACGFNAEGGGKNFNFATRASHSRLHEVLRLDRGRNLRKPKDGYFFRAESFFNVATEIENLERDAGPISGYGGARLHEQSHGESFLALVENRFWGDGLYLLDEPEAALSPKRQLEFLKKLHELVVNKRSQVIIATHSPIILGYPGASILRFGDDGVRPVAYEDTEHFAITRAFLVDRDATWRDTVDE